MSEQRVHAGKRSRGGPVCTSTEFAANEMSPPVQEATYPSEEVPSPPGQKWAQFLSFCLGGVAAVFLILMSWSILKASYSNKVFLALDCLFPFPLLLPH